MIKKMQGNGCINIQAIGDGTIAAGGSIIINGCVVSGAESVSGNGELTTTEREISDFSSMRITGAVDVIYTSGVDTYLSLTADSNIHDLIKTDVVDGCLVVSSSGSYATQNKLYIQCSSHNFEKLVVTGSADTELNQVDADLISIEIKGSGDVQATGRARVVNVQIKGSGDVDLSELKAESGYLGVKGSGDIRAVITESVSASVMGSGDIKIKGNPTNRSVQEKGSGSVKFK